MVGGEVNMDITCSGCGHEAQDGETFTVLINPNSEWWLTLLDTPQYCGKCKPPKLEEEKVNG